MAWKCKKCGSVDDIKIINWGSSINKEGEEINKGNEVYYCFTCGENDNSIEDIAEWEE